MTTTAVKFSMSIAPVLFERISMEAMRLNRSPSEHIVRIILEYLAKSGEQLDPRLEHERLLWELVDEAERTALGIEANHGFSPDITLHTIQACTKNPDWAAKYREFVGDDIFKSGLPEKGRINRELGFRIKAALGAETMKDSTGKVVTVKVLGEIIQSYSRLRK